MRSPGLAHRGVNRHILVQGWAHTLRGRVFGKQQRTDDVLDVRRQENLAARFPRRFGGGLSFNERADCCVRRGRCLDVQHGQLVELISSTGSY